jgi:hypothetical protein
LYRTDRCFARYEYTQYEEIKTMSYGIGLSDSAPVLPSLVESGVRCSACSKPFELGQQVRDNFIYSIDGGLKAIEHLHDREACTTF